MKRKPHAVYEKEILQSSEAIVKVSNSSATYSSEFKVFAVKEYLSEKLPMQIFLEAGVNVDILGREQIIQKEKELSDKIRIKRCSNPF